MKNCILLTSKVASVALLAFLASLATVSSASADEVVSFLVDPDTFDDNNDGFITGNEFDPAGSDGTVFNLVPTNNLVGADRFLLSETNGLHYGGGGGSTLSFDFSVDKDVQLETYTLASSGFFLGNPTFEIREGTTVLSSGNTSNSTGDTHNFASGPINLDTGTTYTFETEVSGAAIQSFMASWEYSVTAVPEPGTFVLLTGLVLPLLIRRRR